MDVLVFLIEKAITVGPLNRVAAGLKWKRPAVIAYLIASAHQSLERPVPPWVMESVPNPWKRRVARLLAGDAKQSADFALARQLSLQAADGETFPAFAAEYLLSAGAAAFEEREFAEAIPLFDRALTKWRSSKLARILEPKVESVASYLKWACFRELGTPKDGLPFLYTAARTHWSPAESCRQWLQLLHEAYETNDERFLLLALQGARQRCPASNEELQYWQDLIRERGGVRSRE